MYQTGVSKNSTCEDENPSYKWDDEKIISYYKRRAREICYQLTKEEQIKKKGLLNYIPKTFKPKFNFHSFHPISNSSTHRTINKPKTIPKKKDVESVLNMLFPYVKEEPFKIEEFKTGADIIKEARNKPNISIIKINQEKRIRSNFNKKFKKYDKELNTYANMPSIRCSSAYMTEDQAYRREFIKSKKKWVAAEYFRRVFGKKTENDRIKEEKLNNNKNLMDDIYIEPYKFEEFREVNRKKWISKKNFIV